MICPNPFDLNDVNVKVCDETAYIHLNIDAQMNTEDLAKIVKQNVGL